METVVSRETEEHMSTGFGQNFGSARGEYDRGRPSYPAEAVAALVGSAVDIADIGAGTGKLTAGLLGEGRDVVAVDPDARMLETLAAHLPEVETRVGTAEDLPLENDSRDLLTFGQSWHWVDADVASAEAARVLRPGGALGLIWNIRDESVDWVAALTEIITPSAAEQYVARIAGGSDGAVVSPFAPPFTDVEHSRFDWVREISVDDLVALVASRSVAIHAEPEVRERMLEQTRSLGDQVRGADGCVRLPYATHVFRSRADG